MNKRTRWMSRMTAAARSYTETTPSPRQLRAAMRAGGRPGDLLAAAI